jgi:hypothetical protein
MRRLARTAILLACLAGTAAPAFADDDAGPIKLGPLQIGQLFCIGRLGNDMTPVEAILTPSLQQAIAAADKRNVAWAKKHPGDEPPLGDGLPWQSTPDYAAICTASHPTASAAQAGVSIDYAYPDVPGSAFSDVLKLRLVNDPHLDDTAWRIDDITLSDGRTMRGELLAAFKK